MPQVLITGGTGLVGRHLCQRLLEKGYGVSVLGRRAAEINEISSYTWSWSKGKIDSEAVRPADFIVHLAGAGIAEKKWTVNRRKIIIDSRVKTAQLILDVINEKSLKPKAFISASAIGYYGAISSDKIFAENDPPAKDFLGETCRQWEEMADRFENAGIRTVKVRTGVVLTDHGGALEKMMTPVKIGIGSAIGSGEQYMPWIHIDDLCGIYIKAIEDNVMRGPYNAVAPEHVTNKEFTRTLARVMKRPFLFPNVPSIAMKMIFGKMSEILLKGSRVSPEKIVSAGFNFKYSNLEKALSHLVGK